MSKRHPENPNLILHTESNYKGLPVITYRGPLMVNYLESMLHTILSAVSEHPRVVGIRFDLHFPAHIGKKDGKVISRFFDSLKAQIKADQKRARRLNQRKHYSEVRYIWVKEQADALFWHYHVLILLNQDAYKWIGDYNATEGNMAARIKKAWASALGLRIEQVAGLVHFADNPIYYLNNISSHPDYNGLAELFYRVSYFAKIATKTYGDNTNHFGSSRF